MDTKATEAVAEDSKKREALQRIRDAIADGKGKEFGLTPEYLDHLHLRAHHLVVESALESAVDFTIQMNEMIQITPDIEVGGNICAHRCLNYRLTTSEEILALGPSYHAHLDDAELLSDSKCRYVLMARMLRPSDNLSPDSLAAAIEGLPWKDILGIPAEPIVNQADAARIIREIVRLVKAKVVSAIFAIGDVTVEEESRREMQGYFWGGRGEIATELLAKPSRTAVAAK